LEKNHNSKTPFSGLKELDEFVGLVNKTWSSKCLEFDPMVVWQFKIRTLRKKIQGWKRNRGAEMKREKAKIMRDLDEIDRLVEENSLSLVDRERRKELSKSIEQI
jgi:hypothetical protein